MMDINDILDARMDLHPIVEETMPKLEDDNNKVIPTVRANPSSMTNLVV